MGESTLDKGVLVGAASSAPGRGGCQLVGAVGQEMLGVIAKPLVGQEGSEGG